ncbi:hypothetical protein DVH05_021879 [Phytophthora capsici]|nr:hypothetical protein DVH05_021879 [Phytophthora capsici]
MAPVLRRVSKKKPGRPQTRKTKTCWRCHVTFSSCTKLKNHLKRKSGCGPKAVAAQAARRKEASRLSSKVQHLKRQLDKVGWWEVHEVILDEEAKDSEAIAGRQYVWVTNPANLERAKGLARLDWSNVIDLR